MDSSVNQYFFSDPTREPESGIIFRKACATSTHKARLARFIKGQPELPTVIAGFSQGAIMSSSLGLSAFIAHGDSDTVLPVSWANEADAWLERLGVAHQTHYYAMGHEIIAEEMADFSAWLTKNLSLSN